MSDAAFRACVGENGREHTVATLFVEAAEEFPTARGHSQAGGQQNGLRLSIHDATTPSLMPSNYQGSRRFRGGLKVTRHPSFCFTPVADISSVPRLPVRTGSGCRFRR